MTQIYEVFSKMIYLKSGNDLKNVIPNDFYQKNVLIVSIKMNVDDDQEWMEIFIIEAIALWSFGWFKK